MQHEVEAIPDEQVVIPVESNEDYPNSPEPNEDEVVENGIEITDEDEDQDEDFDFDFDDIDSDEDEDIDDDDEDIDEEDDFSY